MKQKTFFIVSYFLKDYHLVKNKNLIKIAYTSFKVCARYFLTNFHFSPNGSVSKTMKDAFYFILKILFVIEIFKFLNSLLFLPVSHCFRGWSKINIKVYDVINCLNKNLLTHFAWYLAKEKRYDNENFASL